MSHDFSSTSLVFHGSQHCNSQFFLKQLSNHILLTRPHCVGYANTGVASVTPFKSAYRYQRFGGKECFYLQGLFRTEGVGNECLQKDVLIYQNAQSHIPEEKLSSQLQLSEPQICSRKKQPCNLDLAEISVTCESAYQLYVE